ncbi:alpha/beta fold hydrolase [uncultured Roseobacter sp.]|uniref:alpha/beta hydrolase family protein n=1 Tax=uncultured Roseobacter sp. TaxID=114847 RepID=UPI0026048DF4|nr:alpha/beta fold hydrolase [uncultured Roseobacter sp.]
MKRYAAWGVLALLVALVFAGLDTIRAFEVPDNAAVSEHVFTVQGHHLAGTLVLPPKVDAPPIVLIVHGDGPQDRWSDSTYLPLVNALVARGTGVFSWDKPGIGQSEGDWLAQSMADRIKEAVTAFEYLRDQQGFAHTTLGFLGFSQAGWVVPKVTTDTGAGYAVLIGPAVNWRRQGAYYTSKRLESAGHTFGEIEQAVADNLAENDRIFRDGSVCAGRDDMSAARCAFVRRNYGVDATEDVLAMTTPTLVLMGADDLNVYPSETAELYAKNPHHDVRIVPQATHSLLRAQHFNFQTPADWTALAGLRFLLSGSRAYAPVVLDEISRWVATRAQ